MSVDRRGDLLYVVCSGPHRIVELSFPSLEPLREFRLQADRRLLAVSVVEAGSLWALQHTNWYTYVRTRSFRPSLPCRKCRLRDSELDCA